MGSTVPEPEEIPERGRHRARPHTTRASSSADVARSPPPCRLRVPESRSRLFHESCHGTRTPLVRAIDEEGPLETSDFSRSAKYIATSPNRLLKIRNRSALRRTDAGMVAGSYTENSIG